MDLNERDVLSKFIIKSVSVTNNLKEFWLTRYQETGHTGWQDASIHAYDQIERLATVSDKIDSLTLAPLTAIDFGYGTGDFSRLLLEKRSRV